MSYVESVRDKLRKITLVWIIDNQLGRRNLNDFQRIELVRKCEDAVKAQAKARQAEYHGNQYESGLKEKFPEVQNVGKQSRDELGAMAGVSGKTYEHATMRYKHAHVLKFFLQPVRKR